MPEGALDRGSPNGDETAARSEADGHGGPFPCPWMRAKDNDVRHRGRSSGSGRTVSAFPNRHALRILSAVVATRTEQATQRKTQAVQWLM